ncbi:hypothetical protein GCM10010232_65850 [Streptomyces amakusaensis]|uniref:Transposase n=1 Tax=Streptomyces amakusaensis TaxID=67271 RepID=A0ABW0AUU1_9ACTN
MPTSTRISLPPLLLSTLPPDDLDLSGERRSLKCPDCGTWQDIRRNRIHPHRATLTVPNRPDERQPRCPNAGRPITADITPTTWRAQLRTISTPLSLSALAEYPDAIPAEVRRTTRVKRTGRTPAPAIAQMSPAPVNAATTLTAYCDHLKKCRSSKAAGRCGGTHRCATGTRLAALYERLLRTQPHRDREHQAEARVDALLTRHRAAAARKTTAAEWDRLAGTVDRKALAKRSGTAAEETNNACKAPLAGAVSEFRGPDVPLTRLRPERPAR